MDSCTLALHCHHVLLFFIDLCVSLNKDVEPRPHFTLVRVCFKRSWQPTCSRTHPSLIPRPPSWSMRLFSRCLNLMWAIICSLLLFYRLAEQSMFFRSLYPPFDQGSDFPKSRQGQQYRRLDERLPVNQLIFQYQLVLNAHTFSFFFMKLISGRGWPLVLIHTFSMYRREWKGFLNKKSTKFEVALAVKTAHWSYCYLLLRLARQIEINCTNWTQKLSSKMNKTIYLPPSPVVWRN